jgi:hypothetical protein
MPQTGSFAPRLAVIVHRAMKATDAIAIAAYEQDEEAAPKPAARAIGAVPGPESSASIRSCGAQDCTIAEIAKPNTSAHQIYQPIIAAWLSPSSSSASCCSYAPPFQIPPAVNCRRRLLPS